MGFLKRSEGAKQIIAIAAIAAEIVIGIGGGGDDAGAQMLVGGDRVVGVDVIRPEVNEPPSIET